MSQVALATMPNLAAALGAQEIVILPQVTGAVPYLAAAVAGVAKAKQRRAGLAVTVVCGVHILPVTGVRQLE